VTFSRTGLVIFLEKLWSVGWRSSNLGLLSVGVLCIKVITSRQSASVIAKFSFTNATYNFSFVDCSVILALKQRLFRPTIPQLSPSSNTAVVLKLFLSFPTLNKGGFSSPTCPSSLPSLKLSIIEIRSEEHTSELQSHLNLV